MAATYKFSKVRLRRIVQSMAGLFTIVPQESELSNSTLAGSPQSAIPIPGNTAVVGGAVYCEQQGISITNSTIDGNAAGPGSGGLHNIAVMNVQNTIVSSNTPVNCAGTPAITDGGNNLRFGDFSCPFTNNVQTGNPQLGLLQSNGGATPTRALNTNSAAINMGNNVTCGLVIVTTDQRGITRPIGGTCDIGAFEGQSNEFIVTSTADSGPGSLRQAVIDGAADGRIKFAPGLANLTISLNSSINIPGGTRVTVDATGVSNIIIQGHPFDRVFYLPGSTVADGVLNVKGGLTLANGNANGGAIHIASRGIVTVDNVTLIGTTGNSVGEGGAILNNIGTVTVTNSTITGNNTVTRGGGILNINGGKLIVVNSTISDNTTGTGNGGAIYADANSITTVFNSTLYKNSGTNQIFSASGAFLIENTIIANDTSIVNCQVPVAGVKNLQHPNATCGSGTDWPSANPLLGILTNNGGLTKTRALLAGSPARNVADVPLCRSAPIADKDQRGVPRAAPDSLCDKGAYEGTGSALSAPSSSDDTPATMSPTGQPTRSLPTFQPPTSTPRS